MLRDDLPHARAATPASRLLLRVLPRFRLPTILPSPAAAFHRCRTLRHFSSSSFIFDNAMPGADALLTATFWYVEIGHGLPHVAAGDCPP